MGRNCFEGVDGYTVRRKKTEAKGLFCVYSFILLLSLSVGRCGHMCIPERKKPLLEAVKASDQPPLPHSPPSWLVLSTFSYRASA